MFQFVLYISSFAGDLFRLCSLFNWCFYCLCNGDDFFCRRFAAIGISDDILDGGFFVLIHDMRILMRHGKGCVPEEFFRDGHGDT